MSMNALAEHYWAKRHAPAPHAEPPGGNPPKPGPPAPPPPPAADPGADADLVARAYERWNTTFGPGRHAEGK